MGAATALAWYLAYARVMAADAAARGRQAAVAALVLSALTAAAAYLSMCGGGWRPFAVGVVPVATVAAIREYLRARGRRA